MTLITTAFNGHLGMWSCADADVTRGSRVVNRQWSKQVVLYCVDGVALLTYTGVAEIEGRNTADWICRTVNQQVSVSGALNMLRAALDRLASRWPLVSEALLICGGVLFWRDHPQTYVAVTNVGPDGRVRPRFATERNQVQNTAAIFAAGSGAVRVPEAQRQWAVDLFGSAHEKGHPRDYLGVLARVNRSGAGTGVSEWCQTVFVPYGGDARGYVEAHVPIGADVAGPISPLRISVLGQDASVLFARNVVRRGDLSRARRYRYAWSLTGPH